MNIGLKINGLEEILKTYDANTFKRAINSTLNKVATQAKNEASRQIRSEYNIKASDINKNLRLTTRAGGNKMVAEITGFKRGMALSYFGAKQVGVTAKKAGFRYTRRATKGELLHGGQSMFGGDVSVEVRLGNRKILRGDPKPFITKFKSGHVAILRREGKKRLPVKQDLGPGIALLLGSKKVTESMERLVNEKFNTILQHELNYFHEKSRVLPGR